jgi:hypothetical protein
MELLRTRLLFGMVLSLGLSVMGQGQQVPPTQFSLQEISDTTPRYGPAGNLYLQLSSVGLDKSRVYRVRDLTLDRAALHITLDDGVLAFTEDVAGRVTGAFFEGDGEVLLSPPNQIERASLALFTGAAILEERFVTAYFRFNDDTFADLRPLLNPADGAAEFVSQWNESARNLAAVDALRLLVNFSRLLPLAGVPQPPPPILEPNLNKDGDRLLHVRLQGRTLGIFDLYYDSAAVEQIWAGQLKTVAETSYYDVWTAFSLNDKARPGAATDENLQETRADVADISDYRVKARVKPPTQWSAEAWLQLRAREAGVRTILFELSRFLQLKQVEADGRAVEFIQNQAIEGTQLARRGNDLVAVTFPQPLEPGQKVELHFVYSGQVLSEAGGGLLYVGARGTWYPNRGLAMANFDLDFRYPAGWTLIATGKRADRASAAGVGEEAAAETSAGEQESRWISERPIPLAGFNLGKYKHASARAGDVEVEAYATSGVEREFPKLPSETAIPPGTPSPRAPRLPPLIATIAPTPARNAQTVADASARAIEFYASRFGPYPYGSLALTQMPGDLSQGWPGLIFLSSLSFLTSEEKAELHFGDVEKIIISQVIAHETAHQWWGDLVTWSSYRDQWIAEGLANYSSLMLLESENPQQFRAVMEKYRDDLLQKNKQGDPLMNAGPVTLGARLSSSRFSGGYEAISYGRGTWLFHMLRCMMRDAEAKSGRRATRAPAAMTQDEPFVRALRRLRERYAGKSITTRQMLQVFEEELPPAMWYEHRKSLDWFYDQWVSGTAIPRFELKGLRYVDKSGSTIVSGVITQKDATEELVTLVPVYAVRGGQLELVGQVFADGRETAFHVTAPAGTRKVVLDPHQTLLTRQ